MAACLLKTKRLLASYFSSLAASCQASLVYMHAMMWRCLLTWMHSWQVSGVKVYQPGGSQSEEIIVEFDFMWSGQQVTISVAPVICLTIVKRS